MENLEKLGLIPLSKKECVEQEGGNGENPPIKIPTINPDDFIVCCINIPPMDKPTDGIGSIM